MWGLTAVTPLAASPVSPTLVGLRSAETEESVVIVHPSTLNGRTRPFLACRLSQMLPSHRHKSARAQLQMRYPMS